MHIPYTHDYEVATHNIILPVLIVTVNIILVSNSKWKKLFRSQLEVLIGHIVKVHDWDIC